MSHIQLQWKLRLSTHQIHQIPTCLTGTINILTDLIDIDIQTKFPIQY